jgi:hypothetical protein
VQKANGMPAVGGPADERGFPMAHLKETLFIDTPVASLDSIVGDYRQMPRFWVGLSEPESMVGGPGAGGEAKFTQLMMGVHMHLHMRTTEERHETDGSTFWRWEFEGTTSGFITCLHQPKDGGTQITTDFEYTVPGAVLGKIADRVLVERIQKRDFRHSLETLKLLAESAGQKEPLGASVASAE